MSDKKGLGNPALLALANTDAGKDTVKSATKAIQIIAIVVGTVAASKYAWTKFKKWRAEKYARDNAGNPNLTAAAVIYNSFTRLGFPDSSFMSFLIPEFDISTDEDALNDIAAKVTNAKAVSDAYHILFDRELFFDIKNGLDTTELQTFWNTINSPQNNQDTVSLYPLGTTLYVASKNGITVNIAEKDDAGKWKGTGSLYGNFSHMEKLGKVIAHGVFDNENYYIVEDDWCMWCKTGVVLQHQVTNKQL